MTPIFVGPLPQGSAAWKRWRRDGVGASDLAPILGESPYATAEDIFRGKTEGVEREANFAMRRGVRLEPEARRAYSAKFRLPVEPVCVEHPDAAWVRASLDAWFPSLAVEIKCPGWAEHDGSLQGVVPPKYRPQCQWILLVTDARVLHYASYSPGRRFAGGKELAVVEVRPDAEEQGRLLEAAERFWKKVQAWHRDRAAPTST